MLETSIDQIKLNANFNSGTTPTGAIDCFAIPALRMCFIRGNLGGLVGNMSAGRAWTAATVLGEEYLPNRNVDLYGSSSNNASITVALWNDGQIVIKSQGISTPAGTSFSFSGFWSY